MKKILFKVVYVVFFLVSSLLGLEVAYRTYLRLPGRRSAIIVKYETLLERAWFKPHPHLLYTFKPDNKFVMDAFNKPTFTINKFGFRSTLEYDVLNTFKDPAALRVVTFGGSTTMGVNSDNEIWPYLIGRNLSARYPNKKIEILNEGIQGFNSLENLIDLESRILDFNCDIFIIYLGINDYFSRAPLGIYRADNSHFRKTLWENLSFSAVEMIPGLLLDSKVVAATLHHLGATDRRDLLQNTRAWQFRKSFILKEDEIHAVDNKIKDTIIRNVRSMIGIIKAHNPDALIMLSTFYYYDDPKEKVGIYSPFYQTAKAIENLNSAFYQCAKDSGVVLVDAAGKMPRKKRMAFDYGHFTKEGAKIMSRIFSDIIINKLYANDVG